MEGFEGADVEPGGDIIPAMLAACDSGPDLLLAKQPTIPGPEAQPERLQAMQF